MKSEVRSVSSVNGGKVIKVYSGIHGKCACGCSGKYTYSSKARGRGKELRGYEICEEEISDMVVKRHVRTIEKSGNAFEFGGEYVEAVVGRRVYAAYYE